jgi:hypothetical protein
VASRYGSGSNQKMRLRLRNTDFYEYRMKSQEKLLVKRHKISDILKNSFVKPVFTLCRIKLSSSQSSIFLIYCLLCQRIVLYETGLPHVCDASSEEKITILPPVLMHEFAIEIYVVLSKLDAYTVSAGQI